MIGEFRIQFNFIYIATVAIKMASRCFREIQCLTSNKHQGKKLSFNRRNGQLGKEGGEGGGWVEERTDIHQTCKQINHTEESMLELSG